MTYINRIIEQKLLTQLKLFPAIGLTGPRQSGKSTLLMHLLKNYYQYVNFDQEENKIDFLDDPKRFFRIYKNKVIFDEVQKVPTIFNYIKIEIDNDRKNYGKFILSGSNQFSMLKNITESLAGRIGLLTLLPFQFIEIPTQLQEQSIYKGSYPELITTSYTNSDLWYSSYLTTYLEKDVRNLTNIGNLNDFSRFIRLLAANVTQTLNYSHLANELGISTTTVKRWIAILEASYIIFLLPSYYKNFGKRLIKNSKLYFYDAGLVAYLCKITTKELFEYGPLTGALFENYIISEIKKKNLHNLTNNSLFFYRTSNGVEIDLIIEKPTHKEFIEIKFQDTFRPKMFSAIKTILGEKDLGFVIYNGENRKYDHNLNAINYKDFLC